MSLASQQQASDLYIGYLNYKAAVENVIDAMQHAINQYNQNIALPGYNETVSQDEASWINAEFDIISTTINDFTPPPDILRK